MTQTKYPWIKRQVAEQIYEQVLLNDGRLTVYLVEAPAGLGKTYLARDIGTRLGSPSGYEPAQNGNIIWSGILDIYDPDSNSNLGIERRLRGALCTYADPSAFDGYDEARDMYQVWQRGGIAGSGLEEQRMKVQQAFTNGLNSIASRHRLVLVFDTIERLDRAADATQVEFGFRDDVASVVGWLQYQITHLHSGVIILLGRRVEQYASSLAALLTKLNSDGSRSGPIGFQRLALTELNQGELTQFFTQRQESNPELARLLSQPLHDLFVKRIGGNPLLLDIALQSLLETKQPDRVENALNGQTGVSDLEKGLIQAYMSSHRRHRQEALLYLALARNGLFAELLYELEPASGQLLVDELTQMERDLVPFIKVREIAMRLPGDTAPVPRRVYFLHDAMYTICDEFLLQPEHARLFAAKTAAIYDGWIDTLRRATGSQDTRADLDKSIQDLVTESLFYRMRANPLEGYQWYLQQSDQAIRNAQTSYDMRLHDELSLFLVSAGFEGNFEDGQALKSPIDVAIVAIMFPRISHQSAYDSITQWIKRLTIRGARNMAEEIGSKKLGALERVYLEETELYRLSYAEFLLWYAQALMYGGDYNEAISLYHRIVDDVLHIERVSPRPYDLDVGQYQLRRLSLVLGRAFNNLGYTAWNYQGKYHLAIQYFQEALHFFKQSGLYDLALQEEIANANDNMGRVYAQLGIEFPALQLIQNGLESRRKLGLTFREALSFTSLAHAHVRFGANDKALHAVSQALIQFRRIEVQRGIGLGLLTQGMIYRNVSDAWRETGSSATEAMRFTDLAETDLRDAVRIFTSTVHEPLREVQARNELGCSYRARHDIQLRTSANETEVRLAFNQARIQFREAMDAARQYGYMVDMLDSMQDYAVVLVRSEQYDAAISFLGQIRDHIRVADARHLIRTGIGLVTIPVDQRVDAFYKLLGQVELLEGAIEFERERVTSGDISGPNDLPPDDVIVNTALKYLFAVSYFRQYSDEAFALRHTYARIYKRFQYCRPELVRQITDTLLPEWLKDFHLPESTVRGLLRDVFGLFD